MFRSNTKSTRRLQIFPRVFIWPSIPPLNLKRATSFPGQKLFESLKTKKKKRIGVCLLRQSPFSAVALSSKWSCNKDVNSSGSKNRPHVFGASSHTTLHSGSVPLREVGVSLGREGPKYAFRLMRNKAMAESYPTRSTSIDNSGNSVLTDVPGA